MSPLDSKDPNVAVAVLVERIAYLQNALVEMRDEMRQSQENMKQETRAEFAQVRSDLARTRTEMSGINDVLNKGRFLYLSLIGLGIFASWALGFWDKIRQLFV